MSTRMTSYLSRGTDIMRLRREVLRKGFAVQADFLNPGVLEKIRKAMLRLPTRKRVQTTMQPKWLYEFSQQVGDLCGAQPDTAVFKYYDQNEEHESGAYRFHRDPPEYGGIFLLLTIAGEAKLKIRKKKETMDIPCKPNTLVAMLAHNGGRYRNENLVHRVTKPVTQRRYVLFLGCLKRNP